jgi:hypothetical protein
MQVVERSATRLVLRERPWLESFVGALFVVVGIVFLVQENDGPRWLLLLFVAAGAAVLVFFAKVVTCVFDRGSNQFVREARGLVGSTRRGASLTDITRVRVDRRSGSKGPTYQVELQLASGKPIPLPTGSSSGLEPKQRTARMIREFLGMPADPDADGEGPTFGEAMSILLGKDGDRIGAADETR